MIIQGIGVATPEHQIEQLDAATISQRFANASPSQQRLLETLYRRSGVSSRNSVVLDSSEGPLDSRQTFYGDTSPSTSTRMQKYESTASDLALTSASRALEDAGIDSQRITHLVTVSCSGFHAPGFDIGLARRLPLRPVIARTHIGFMGCQGALNGLRVARAFTEADPNACVLLCAVELCSLHHQYGWQPEQIVANALFADGAAAVVGSGKSFEANAGAYRMVSSGSTLIENSEDEMSWRIGDNGFVMTLSARVPELIASHLRPWLDDWLARAGIDLASVGSWAVHPGGPRILSAFGETVGIPRTALDASYDVLATHGNMSSPTVLFIIDRLRRASAPRPCVALAFGPGLTVEAALLV